ncbi:hypothetical protein M378DRAFT_162735 [Amanita muscaria Koide BX008]|uniref:Uncharacterized protein n=1 Tax=Amanita muscaria (strain Koide BX008) TaxID=946122 RepID=A0A0C2X6G4_AMAMK|nr:hypothetical protein M378DRAFT_162735 [Amanita muscaria Koide BX008]
MVMPFEWAIWNNTLHSLRHGLLCDSRTLFGGDLGWRQATNPGFLEHRLGALKDRSGRATACTRKVDRRQ